MPTKIEWCDEVWNPIYCYAERMAKWLKATTGITQYQEVVDENGWAGDTWFVEDMLDVPLHWRKGRRISVCSMSDLFHESTMKTFLAKVLEIIADKQCRHHTFITTTKRAKEMRQDMTDFYREYEIKEPLPNFHPGISISTQDDLDKNIEYLLETPAAVRWISIEPMLEAIDFKKTICKDGDHLGPTLFNHGAGAGINWVALGCESGPGRRPMKLQWAVDVVDQCRRAGVPVFVKQLDIGGKVVKDVRDFPLALRVREYPK